MICISIASFSCNSKKDYTVLDFNSLSFNKSLVSFGDSSDVIIQGLQKENLTIAYEAEKNQFKWKLIAPAYVKLNRTNKNSVKIDSIKSIIVNSHETTIKDFKNRLAQIKEQDLISLKEFLSVDSSYNFPTTIKSIYSQDSSVFILLDTVIKLKTFNNDTIAFRFSGEIPGNKVSVQFYKYILSNQFPSNTKKTFFKIGDTTFFINRYSYYTNFGASLIDLVADKINNSAVIKVGFNKPYRYTFSPSLIKGLINRNSDLPINIRQEFQATSFDNDLYIQNFSFYYQDIIAKVNKEGKITANTTLTYYTMPFWAIYLIPLFLTYLLIFYFLIKSSFGKFVFNNIYVPINPLERINWKIYFALLLTVLFLFLVFRIYISFQLSYTSPFFTNLFPLQVIISPLILIFVYAGWSWSIFSFSISDTNNRANKKRIQNKGFILLLISISFFLCYLSALFPVTHDYIVQFLFKDFSWNPLVNLKSKNSSFYIFIYLFFGFLFFSAIIRNSLLRLNISYLVLLLILLFAMAKFLSNGYSAIMLLIILISQYLVGSNSSIISNEKRKEFVEYFKKRNWAKKIEDAKNSIFEFPPLIKVKNSLSMYFFVPPTRDRYLLLYSVSIIIAVFLFASYFKNDTGYFINLYLIVFIVPFMLLLNANYYSDELPSIKSKKRKNLNWSFCRTLVLITITISAAFFYLVNTISYSVATFQSRTESRLATFYSFNRVEDAGLKKSESIAQFFAVLSKYVDSKQSKELNYFHPAISRFSDPIVINDLSFPVTAISTLGSWALIITGLLWIILTISIFKMSLVPYSKYDLADRERKVKGNNQLTTFGFLRLIALCYFLGSGLWLLLSYYSIVPFTGRILFGLGQDSVGEILETMILFITFGLIYNKSDKI